MAQEREVLSNNPSCLQQARIFGRKHPVREGSGGNSMLSCQEKDAGQSGPLRFPPILGPSPLKQGGEPQGEEIYQRSTCSMPGTHIQSLPC